MAAPTYELALVPCAKKKNPVGVTPLTLYRSTPFILNVRHAQQRCNRLLVVSAKYGLLTLNDRVAFYEANLTSLSQKDRLALAITIATRAAELGLLQIDPKRVLCYLNSAYYDFLANEVPSIAGWIANVRRPYVGVGQAPLRRILSNEIKGFESTGLARR